MPAFGVVTGHDVPTVVFILGAIFIALFGIGLLVFHPNAWLMLSVISAIGFALSLYAWELLIGFMIAVGFFAGSFRMVYANWAAYLIPEVLVVFVLVRWAMGRFSTGGTLFSRTAVTLPVALLTFYCALEFFNPAAPFMRSLFGLRSWLLYTLLFFAGYEGYRNPKQVDSLTRLIIVLGTITACYGIWQWVIGPERFAELGPRFAIHAQTSRWGTVDGIAVLRVPASFSTSTGFAANMGMIIILALGLLLSPTTTFRWRVLCLAGIAVMACGIAVSGSRMGPAILVISIAIVLSLMRRARAVFSILVALAAGYWLINQINGGVLSERFATVLTPKVFFWKWSDPLLMGFTNMWAYPIGYGLGYAAGLPSFIAADSFVASLRTGAVADSGYGTAGLEIGIPGMVLLLLFALQLSYAAYKSWTNLSDTSTKDLFLGPAVWAISFPVMLLFSSMSASAPSSMYQWILIGMLLRAGSRDPQPDATRRWMPKRVMPTRPGRVNVATT